MTTIDRNGSLHAGDGRYTNKPQSAADFDLTEPASDRTAAFVEHMIANGNFSPAARDMDVRDVIDQYCESHVETFERKAQMYEAADVLMRGKYHDLVSGDLVDLEPLLREYGNPEAPNLEADLMAAESELAEVDNVTLDAPHLGTAVIWNFQTNIAVPVDADIDYKPNMATRCAACGDEVRDEDFVGNLCQDCDEDQHDED